MNGHYLKSKRSLNRLSWALSLAVSLSGALLFPGAADAQTQEPLTWARIDFLRNRVQFVPQNQQSRGARISDVLSVGDALRTARASRAELRFNDGSLARIGERATFRFTPNTRNFQLSNGTILLLIPPGRGRSTIQTPNAVTGIQGSALFVRYIPETDTTIVGALTNNPDGPMVLFNRDGTEQQALRANEIGVIQGNQITELYEFDGTLFWQSSGLAEGFNYLSDSSSGEGSDPLNGVRQEIRDAISNQGRISGDNVITNPEAFVGPSTEINDDVETEGVGTPTLEFENSPAQEYLDSSAGAVDERELDIGVNNSLAPQPEAESTVKKPTTEVETSDDTESVVADEENDEPSATQPSTQPSATQPSATEPAETDSAETDSTETGTGTTETAPESGVDADSATDSSSDNSGPSENNGTDNTSVDNTSSPQNGSATSGSDAEGNSNSAPASPASPAPASPASPAPTSPASPAPTSPASPAPTSPASPAIPASPAPTSPDSPASTVPISPASTVPIFPAEGIDTNGSASSDGVNSDLLPDAATTIPTTDLIGDSPSLQAVPEEVEQLNELQVTNDLDTMNTMNNASPPDGTAADAATNGPDDIAPAASPDNMSNNAQGAALSVPSGDNSLPDVLP